MDFEKSKIVVLGDGPTCTGFKLAGIHNVYPKKDKEAEEKMEELLSSEEVGIIIVNENLMEEMNWRIKKKIDKIAKPVVITIPDKSGPMEETDSLNSMIKKALGFEINK